MSTLPGPRILICDDDALVRDSLCVHLRTEGYRCLEASDGVEALELAGSHEPAAIVLDLAMPRMDGLTALRKLRERGDEVPVVVLTGSEGVESAIAATRLGASAYLQKPADVREVGLALERVLAQERLARRVAVLESASRGSYGEFVGRSPALAELYATLVQLETVAAPTVLLLGESGTGKDVLARTIHTRGPRRDELFVEVDCPSLPETLFESEVFGHERGAFTDARERKRGLFEVAAGGTVFLDEIGELAPGSQAKLLRALQNRRFKRVGGIASLELDAGVIAATNRDLRAEVEAGRFREDLFYRLDVVTLRVPPLRERKEDIPLLVAHFLDKLDAQFRRGVEGLAPEAMECLLAYDWPGNVRELRNVLERIVILSPAARIEASALPAAIRYGRATQTGSGHGLVLPEGGVDLAELERDLVLQALERTGGNKAAAARLLGLSRHQLRTRIKRYELHAWM